MKSNETSIYLFMIQIKHFLYFHLSFFFYIFNQIFYYPFNVDEEEIFQRLERQKISLGNFLFPVFLIAYVSFFLLRIFRHAKWKMKTSNSCHLSFISNYTSNLKPCFSSRYNYRYAIDQLTNLHILFERMFLFLVKTELD